MHSNRKRATDDDEKAAGGDVETTRNVTYPITSQSPSSDNLVEATDCVSDVTKQNAYASKASVATNCNHEIEERSFDSHSGGVASDESLFQLKLPRKMKKDYNFSGKVIQVHNLTVTAGNKWGDDDDELILGASASPTATDSEDKPEKCFASPYIRNDIEYVGLVNQAMTCYLNSLLQTLYMTPEFRNALYRWEYKGSAEEASKNIPFQLQKLFLQLQTASRSAVETTNLTKSFGWDSSEAWQQHDIQELCRVMFDALEQCFKNTDQSNLIIELYQGKMKDYVKCLSCGTESAREDAYLDIPLPIRPFGSDTAYQSVEEALKAFVEPELLTGVNKYECSKCGNLCDAHKGLKFMHFPYLLTLHLKRFDFDYQTFHRIKLNDRVTFPYILDLNAFIEGYAESDVNTVTVDKVDDASNSDSGSALDVDENSTENTSSSQHDLDNQEEDEGIDVSSVYNSRSKLSNGPYVFELFSIMVHSGSASGGHYYAYIKDFHKDEWFCFNDQHVSKITAEDVEKTYGGGVHKGYYSTFTTSANAYMLMYRQIDKVKNVNTFTEEELPPHIKRLIQNMVEEEEAEREAREIERCMCQIKLFCQHPKFSQLIERKLRFHKETTLSVVTKLAYEVLELESVVPIDRCRLVKYEEFHDSIECSFECQEDTPIAEIPVLRNSYKFDFFMEIREEHMQFEVYKPGGITVKVYIVDIKTEEVEGPHIVRILHYSTIRELKELIGTSLQLNPDTMRIVKEKYNALRPLTSDEKTLKCESFYKSNNVFVEASGEEPNDFFAGSIMYSILDRYANTITVFCSLPDISQEILEELQIPLYKIPENNLSSDANFALESNIESPASSQDSGMSSKGTEVSPCGPNNAPSPVPILNSELTNNFDNEDEGIVLPGSSDSVVNSDQSTSEDSSLTSDSDRTLVGDPPDYKVSDLSPSPEYNNVSSPEEEEVEDNVNKVAYWKVSYYDSNEIHFWNEDRRDFEKRYFRAEYCKEDNKRYLRARVDKRITVQQIKEELQKWVGVPQDQEFECTKMGEMLTSYGENAKLTIRLGRALQPGEHKGKVYLFNAYNATEICPLIDWILCSGDSIAKAKEGIIKEVNAKHKMHLVPEKVRLRKKSWRSPLTVYLDSQVFDDHIPLYSNWELFLQVLDSPEEKTANSDNIVLFAKKWSPSTYTASQLHEIVVSEATVESLKSKLSVISGIPVEDIEFTKGKGTFPCDMAINAIQEELDWSDHKGRLDQRPLCILDDGAVIYFRDSKEKLKVMSEEEMWDLINSEKRRLNPDIENTCASTSFVRMRERGLKIYLNSKDG